LGNIKVLFTEGYIMKEKEISVSALEHKLRKAFKMGQHTNIIEFIDKHGVKDDTTIRRLIESPL